MSTIARQADTLRRASIDRAALVRAPDDAPLWVELVGADGKVLAAMGDWLVDETPVVWWRYAFGVWGPALLALDAKLTGMVSLCAALAVAHLAHWGLAHRHLLVVRTCLAALAVALSAMALVHSWDAGTKRPSLAGFAPPNWMLLRPISVDLISDKPQPLPW